MSPPPPSPSWARHTATLPHPDGGEGSACYVLGTAHISASSAAEAGDLIRALRPHAVVVELDAERYAALQRTQRARRGQASAGGDVSSGVGGVSDALAVVSRADSAPKLASLLARGDAVPFAGALGYALAGALLGAIPGGEFASAIDAAEDVGATLILGDRDFRVTLARLRARLGAAAGEARAEGRGAARKEEALPGSPLPLMRAAGCVSPEAALEAAKRLLRDATGAAPRVAVEDLRAVRACAAAVVEHARERELRAAAADARAAGGTPPGVALERQRTHDGQAGDSSSRDASAAKEAEEDAALDATSSIARGLPPPAAAAVQRTLVAERDLILARAMQLPLQHDSGTGGRVVVGVVGAGHVRGICREWRGARSPEAYARAQEALVARPAEVPPPGAGAFFTKAALAAGGGALALARPRGALKLAAFVGMMGAFGCAGGAAGVRAAGRALTALDAADAALRRQEEETALQAHAGSWE
jgi:pheromone shutdown protein TraB